MKKRKQVAMTLIVTVPNEMTAADARKEVRCLINDQCMYAADYGEIKVKSLKGLPKTYLR